MKKSSIKRAAIPDNVLQFPSSNSTLPMFLTANDTYAHLATVILRTRDFEAFGLIEGDTLIVAENNQVLPGSLCLVDFADGRRDLVQMVEASKDGTLAVIENGEVRRYPQSEVTLRRLVGLQRLFSGGAQ